MPSIRRILHFRRQGRGAHRRGSTSANKVKIRHEIPFLPPRVVSTILSFLCFPPYPLSREDLRACSLVCRTWRPIAQSLLFQHTTVTLTLTPRTWYNALSKFISFLERLPEVAACISSLVIQGSEFERTSANLVPATIVYKMLSLLPRLKNLSLGRIFIYVLPVNRVWPVKFALEHLKLIDIGFAYGGDTRPGSLDLFLSAFTRIDVLTTRGGGLEFSAIDPSKARSITSPLPESTKLSLALVYPAIQHLDIDFTSMSKFLLRYLAWKTSFLPAQPPAVPTPIRKLRLNLVFRSHWTDALTALQYLSNPRLANELEELELTVHIIPVLIGNEEGSIVPTTDHTKQLCTFLTRLTHLRVLTLIAYPNSSSQASIVHCVKFVAQILCVFVTMTGFEEVRLGLPCMVSRVGRGGRGGKLRNGGDGESWNVLDDVLSLLVSDSEVGMGRKVVWLVDPEFDKRGFMHDHGKRKRTWRWLRCQDGRGRLRDVGGREEVAGVVGHHLPDLCASGVLMFEDTVFPEDVGGD